ncbi:MAG: hypothetical protein ACM3Q2_10715 [Syntrophothermus sp.]
MKYRFAGISRKTEFSPKHEVNDLMILTLTAENLKSSGAEVNIYDESMIDNGVVKEKFIFSMVQGPAGIARLRSICRNAAWSINSPESVFACYRMNMLRLLPASGIPIPRSMIISSSAGINGEVSQFASEKLWLKRGDVHAVKQGDVISITTSQESVNSYLKEFRERKIDKVILQEHLPGDVIKFYGVRETGFFYWYYTEMNEKNAFNAEEMRALAETSAEVLGLYVYGGDAITGKDGCITVIDINDWPSFAPVREEAARNIAQLLLKKADEYGHDN